MKRLCDVLLGLLLLPVALPLLAATGLAVLLVDGRPVLFRQPRVGLGGREFMLWKFRTLKVNRIPVEQLGVIGPGHEMVTPLGRLMRRYKLDELPQLFNVLRGDMSLVGPRPTIREQVDRYTPFERRRLEVRPGMTGWSQVNGNASLTWSDRIRMDVWYVDHRSLLLDVRILLRTALVVITGERPVRRAVDLGRAHAQRVTEQLPTHLPISRGTAGR